MTYFSADEVNEICNRLRNEDFPCDVIHLDTGWFKTDWLCEWKFNDERFPDPKKFMAELRKEGFRVSLWQMPYIAAEAEQHDEAVENNYIGPLDEAAQQDGSNFSALDYAGTIDFTYPKAVEWYKHLLKNLLEKGTVCIKTDFGEEIHMNAKYHSMEPHLLKNLYALLYQKAAFEITKEVTGDGIIWARAGWAGCQRFPLHWGGDAACTWDGMAGSLKGGLHLGLSGFGFWSHDAPVMNSDNIRDVYLPKGLWINLFDGSVQKGEKWIKEMHVPLNEMPVWAKFGAKIPVYPEAVNCTDEMDLSKSIELEFDETFKGLDNTALGNVING